MLGEKKIERKKVVNGKFIDIFVAITWYVSCTYGIWQISKNYSVCIHLLHLHTQQRYYSTHSVIYFFSLKEQNNAKIFWFLDYFFFLIHFVIDVFDQNVELIKLRSEFESMLLILFACVIQSGTAIRACPLIPSIPIGNDDVDDHQFQQRQFNYALWYNWAILCSMMIIKRFMTLGHCVGRRIGHMQKHKTKNELYHTSYSSYK